MLSRSGAVRLLGALSSVDCSTVNQLVVFFWFGFLMVLIGIPGVSPSILCLWSPLLCMICMFTLMVHWLARGLCCKLRIGRSVFLAVSGLRIKSEP